MPGLLRGVARTAVIAGTATAVSNNVSRRQAGRWAQQDAQAGAQQTYVPRGSYEEVPPQAPPAAPAGDPAADRIAALKELAALRDQGVLTEAEFAAEKAKLLG